MFPVEAVVGEQGLGQQALLLEQPVEGQVRMISVLLGLALELN